MSKPTVTIIPATPGFTLLLACFPGKSRDGGAYVGHRSPIVGWAVESDYRGHRDEELHTMVQPVTIDGCQHVENEAAVLHPDGTTVDVVGSGERFEGHNSVKDWLSDVDESAKLVEVA